jgi:hypothetical protein
MSMRERENFLVLSYEELKKVTIILIVTTHPPTTILIPTSPIPQCLHSTFPVKFSIMWIAP